MKITLYEFKQLPEQEQYNIAFHKGTFLDHYITAKQKFSLFAVDKFFVEVEYNSEDNRIVGKSTFKTGKRLFKYSNFKGKTL